MKETAAFLLLMFVLTIFVAGRPIEISDVTELDNQVSKGLKSPYSDEIKRLREKGKATSISLDELDEFTKLIEKSNAWYIDYAKQEVLNNKSASVVTTQWFNKKKERALAMFLFWSILFFLFLQIRTSRYPYTVLIVPIILVANNKIITYEFWMIIFAIILCGMVNLIVNKIIKK